MTSDTSPRPIISPLRARMIEDMSVRGFKEDTRRADTPSVLAAAARLNDSARFGPPCGDGASAQSRPAR
jgi:hypothetical protein